MIEWKLNTPVQKEFRYLAKRKISESGKEVEIDEPVTEIAKADTVRLHVVHNDKAFHRFTIRFFYGRIKENGNFEAAHLDDGVVFSGPTYLEHEFHINAPKDEQVLLDKVAKFLNWDGAMKISGEK